MGTDLHGIAVRDTEAALRGIARDLPQAIEHAEWLQIPLARIGDALRLGLDVPRNVRDWLGALSVDLLKGALASVTEETSTWSLPGDPVAPVDEADDPFLSTVIRRRDEAESVRAAVRRATRPKGHLVDDWPEYVALTEALATVDLELRRLVTRPRVLELLGARAALRTTWTDALGDNPVGTGSEVAGTDAGSEDAGSSGSPPLAPEALATVSLGDEDVASYAKHGTLARLVEGLAAATPTLAEELAECIDALLEAHEQVGLVARRWRQAYRIRGASNPLILAHVPGRRLAAATTTVAEVEATTVHLGALSPLDAEAWVELTAHHVTLGVSPGHMPLARIELGESFVAAPDEDGTWRIKQALPAGLVHLRVVAADGRAFASELGFAAATPSDEAQ